VWGDVGRAPSLGLPPHAPYTHVVPWPVPSTVPRYSRCTGTAELVVEGPRRTHYPSSSSTGHLLYLGTGLAMARPRVLQPWRSQLA